MKSRYAAFFALTVGFLVFPQIVSAESAARVRVLHASVDAPPVDILVNDSVAIEDLSFGNIAGYVSLPSGSYSIKVRGANTTGPDVISTNITVRGGRDYTIAASGTLSSIKAAVYEDSNVLANKNKGKLRVIHLSPGAPAVDIAEKGGKVLLSNVSFENASDYLRLKSGSYDLEVRVAGTQNVVLNLPDVMIESGKVYQIYAVGVVGGTPAFGVRVSMDEGISMRQAQSRRWDSFESRFDKFNERFQRFHY